MKSGLPRSFYLILFVILIAGNISVYRTIFTPNVLKISVLEMDKKGSAVLVQNSGGTTILINTGPDASILRALGSEFPPWKRRIDVVLLTSITTQTAGGLPEVLNRYHVSTLIRSSTQGSRSLEASLAAAADAEKGMHQITALFGERLALSRDVYITAISPDTFSISYGATLFKISTTTPTGVYISDGNSIQKQ